MMAKKKKVEETRLVHVSECSTPYGMFSVMVFKDKKGYDLWIEIIHGLIGEELEKSYGSVVTMRGRIIYGIPVDASEDTIVHEIMHVAQRLEVPFGNKASDDVELLPTFVSTIRGMIAGIIMDAQKEFGGKK